MKFKGRVKRVMKKYILVLLFFVLTACVSNEQSTHSNDGVASSMVFISGGDFLMGSPLSEKDRDADERLHEVSVPSFKLSKYEVTKREFAKFVKATGYITDAERAVDEKHHCREYNYVDEWKLNKNMSWRNAKLIGQKQSNEKHPVVCVSWRDSQNYIKWLNETTGESYRLPTEAELEYVSRAGSQSRFTYGEKESNLCLYGNIADITKFKSGEQWRKVTPCSDGISFTNEVGKYKPNPFGVYDINGNVWEWTCSAFHKSYENNYELSCAPLDFNKWLAVRGGSYSSVPRYLRSANRLKRKPFQSFANSGFRLAKDLKSSRI